MQTVLQLFPFCALPVLLGQGSFARILGVVGCATLGLFARIAFRQNLLVRLIQASIHRAGVLAARGFGLAITPGKAGSAVRATVKDRPSVAVIALSAVLTAS